MKKNEPLTITLHINGEQVETLTEKQREIIAQRLSKAMSQYYSCHPEEYMKISVSDSIK